MCAAPSANFRQRIRRPLTLSSEGSYSLNARRCVKCPMFRTDSYGDYCNGESSRRRRLRIRAPLQLEDAQLREEGGQECDQTAHGWRGRRSAPQGEEQIEG